MSEISTSLSTGSSGGGGEVVRGEGNAPGQSAGEVMPPVTTTERKSLSDFQRDMAEKNARAAARTQQQPQTAKSRIGAFSDALEKRQQAPVAPHEARQPGQPEETPKEPPEVPQLAEPDPNAPLEQQAAEGEEQPAEQQALTLDDKAALEKYRQWEQDDMFPAELESKLHELKVNGQTRYVPTTELKQGYMRGGDYRRFYGEVQQREQAVARKDQAMQAHFEAIRDPEQMLEIYERNGYGETLMKVAEKLQERQRYRQGIIEGAGIAAMRALGMRQADWNHKDVQAAMQRAQADLERAHAADIKQRQLEFREHQLNQQQQQTASQQRMQEYSQLFERQLNQLRPNAFRAYGIPDTAGHRQGLARHLSNVIKTPEFAQQFAASNEITRAMVMAAAADLKQENDDSKQRERGLDLQSMRPAGGGKPLPPNRIAAGGGAPLGNLGGRKQGSLADLEAMVRRSRGL